MFKFLLKVCAFAALAHAIPIIHFDDVVARRGGSIEIPAEIAQSLAHGDFFVQGTRRGHIDGNSTRQACAVLSLQGGSGTDTTSVNEGDCCTIRFTDLYGSASGQCSGGDLTLFASNTFNKVQWSTNCADNSVFVGVSSGYTVTAGLCLACDENGDECGAEGKFVNGDGTTVSVAFCLSTDTTHSCLPSTYTYPTPSDLTLAPTPKGVTAAPTPLLATLTPTPEGVTAAPTPQSATLPPTPEQAHTPQTVTVAPTPDQAHTPQPVTVAPTPGQTHTPQPVTVAPTPEQAHTPQTVTVAPTPEQARTPRATLAPTPGQAHTRQPVTVAPTPEQAHTPRATLAPTPRVHVSQPQSTGYEEGPTPQATLVASSTYAPTPMAGYNASESEIVQHNGAIHEDLMSKLVAQDFVVLPPKSLSVRQKREGGYMNGMACLSFPTLDIFSQCCFLGANVQAFSYAFCQASEVSVTEFTSSFVVDQFPVCGDNSAIVVAIAGSTYASLCIPCQADSHYCSGSFLTRSSYETSLVDVCLAFSEGDLEAFPCPPLPPTPGMATPAGQTPSQTSSY